jgi:phenylalanyl-tRNA synthetase beta chain
VEVLRRLGLEVTEAPGLLTVTPPSWRFDLQIEEDLIEEVVRVLGYQNLPDTPPVAPIRAHVRSESRRGVHALRHALAALDYQETINFSFVEERWERELAGNDNPIRVLNPIASPLSVMRSGLIGSLVSVLRFNLARKATRVRISEIGRVFKRDAAVADGVGTVAGIEQPLRVAGLAYESVDELQWGTKARQVDFFDAKGDVEALLAPRVARFVPAAHPALHPGRSARVEVDGRAIGFVGELHPQWRQAYELPGTPVVFELDAAALMEQPLPAFQAIPRQQSAWRDIAVIAGEQVSHDALIDAAKAANSELVRSVKLFDVYKPATGASTDMAAGERSLALRLEILDDSTTLTDERIESVKAEVVAALSQKLGVRLRA